MFPLQSLCRLTFEHSSFRAGLWLRCLMEAFSSGTGTAITRFAQGPTVQSGKINTC